MDFANLKSLTIPEGEVKEIYNGDVLIWKSGPTNLVPLSTSTAGGTAIYNNGLGYKNGYRLSSSGAEKTQSGSTVTGFIPAKYGDVIRMKGVTWGTNVVDGYSYISFYNSSGTLVTTVNRYMNDDANGVSNHGNYINKNASSILTDSNGVTTFNIVFTQKIDFSYIRINATGDGADMIVTVNEEID